MSKRILIFLALVGLAWLLVFLISLVLFSAWRANARTLFELLGISAAIVGILGAVMAGVLAIFGFFKEDGAPHPDAGEVLPAENIRSMPKDSDYIAMLEATTHSLLRPLQVAGVANPPEPLGTSPLISSGAMTAQRLVEYIERGEIEDGCRALLRACQAVAIVGASSPGGIGKTELAIQAATELTDDGTFSRLLWVDCGERTPDHILMDMLSQCDLEVPPGTDFAERIAFFKGFLGQRNWLVVLDDVRAANVAALGDLLPPSPPCAALVTSRIELLSAPVQVLRLGEMTEAECLSLLKTRLWRTVNWGPETEGVGSLFRTCSYNPLALLIAANQIPGMPPEKRNPTSLVEEIKAGFQHLPIPASDPRSALFSVFDSSYGGLTEQDRRRFNALAAFDPASFTLEAVAAIWGDEAQAARGAIERMSELSLLEPAPSHTGRLRLHDLLHGCAALKLTASGEEIAVRAAHAAHYAAVLGEANQLFGRGGDSVRLGLRLYDTESANIRVGQAWAAGHIKESTVAAEAANWYAWQASILGARLDAVERVHWIESGLAASEKLGNKKAETAHLNNLGSAYADLGQRRRSIQLFKRALALDRATGNRRGEGNALHNLGNAYSDLGEPRKAIPFYEQRLKIAHETNNVSGESSALYDLGSAYAALGEPHQSIQFYERHLAIARKTRDRQGEAEGLGSLGNAYAALGETRKARQLYEEQLVILEAMGDRHAEATALGNLGNAYADLGETSQAISLYEKQLAIVQEIGDRHGEGTAYGNLASAYADLGETRQAISLYEKQLVIVQEIDDRRGEGALLGNLGLVYAALGETRRAIRFYEQALDRNQRIGDPRAEGAVLGNLGNAYSDLGEPRKAIVFYEQHLAIAREIGDRRGEGNALGNIGNAHVDLGELEEAIPLHEQHLAIARETGDRRGEGAALGNLGLAHASLGEPREALKFYEQHLTIAREIGDRRDEANALANMGNAHADLDETQEAIPLYEQALVIDREIGDRRAEALASWNLGLAYEEQGQLRKAVEAMQVCLDFEQEIGHPDAEKDAAHAEDLRARMTNQSQPLKEHISAWTSKARSWIPGRSDSK